MGPWELQVPFPVHSLLRICVSQPRMNRSCLVPRMHIHPGRLRRAQPFLKQATTITTNIALVITITVVIVFITVLSSG